MVEAVILKFLSKELGAIVKMERPEKPPERYYLIEKTGGSFDRHIYRSTLAIQSCAETLYEAARMNDAAKQAMLYEAVKLPEICHVDLNADYNYTTDEQYRYQAVFDIIHY